MSGILGRIVARSNPMVRTVRKKQGDLWCGPPARRFPGGFPMKVVHGVIICLCTVGPFGYLVSNLKHYKNTAGGQ